MTSSRPNLLVVIPAWNEQSTISDIVREIKGFGYDVLVIDDGSIDKTAELAQVSGAMVSVMPCNIGYESALNFGVEQGITKGYEFLATFDADGQFSARDLGRFMQVQRACKADVVIGHRDRLNRYAELLMNSYGRWRFGIRDPLCGMKLYRCEAAKRYMPFDSFKLVGIELACKMSDGGLKVAQVPVKVIARRDSSRYGGSLRGELKILKSFVTSLRFFGFSRKNG